MKAAPSQASTSGSCWMTLTVSATSSPGICGSTGWSVTLRGTVRNGFDQQQATAHNQRQRANEQHVAPARPKVSAAENPSQWQQQGRQQPCQYSAPMPSNRVRASIASHQPAMRSHTRVSVCSGTTVSRTTRPRAARAPNNTATIRKLKAVRPGSCQRALRQASKPVKIEKAAQQSDIDEGGFLGAQIADHRERDQQQPMQAAARTQRPVEVHQDGVDQQQCEKDGGSVVADVAVVIKRNRVR